MKHRSPGGIIILVGCDISGTSEAKTQRQTRTEVQKKQSLSRKKIGSRTQEISLTEETNPGSENKVK